MTAAAGGPTLVRTVARAAAAGLGAFVVTAVVSGVLAQTRGPDRPVEPPTTTETESFPPVAVEPAVEPSEPLGDDPGELEVPTLSPTEESTAAEDVDQPGQGVTVQVLDGVGDDTRAQAAADALRELGYEVVVVNPAAVAYDTTTVVFTEGNRAAAETLVGADARFTQVRPNDDLSQEVDLHVVVGEDWPQP